MVVEMKANEEGRRYGLKMTCLIGNNLLSEEDRLANIILSMT